MLKQRNQGSVGFHASVHTSAFGAAFPRPEQSHSHAMLQSQATLCSVQHSNDSIVRAAGPELSLRTASIFVQRWSARLAAELREATQRRHMHAWAEIATPSLCRRANLTIGALHAAHRGALFHACCTKHVKTTSRNFLPDERRFLMRTNASVVKLYHPVKF